MKFRDILFSDNIITEVFFDVNVLEKAVNLYSKIIGKQMGGDFKNLGIEDFKRSTGPGKGFRTMNPEGYMIRFNWDQKLTKDSKFTLTSLDFWENTNHDFTLPSYTIHFTPDLNVVQVLDKIIKSLKTGRMTESEELVSEARSRQEKINWLKANGLPVTLNSSERLMKDRAEKEGKGEALAIFLGEKEVNSFEQTLKAEEKIFDSKVYADPETVFEDIEDLLSLVASNQWRTLIICGQGGIGKTFHVTEGSRSLTELLGPEGDKWTYHSGTKAAPFSFYKTLFQERNKVIVFDEADSLLKNQDIIMMLKPLLDTSGKNMASYMAGTKNMVGLSDQEIKEYSEECDSRLADGEMIGTGKKDVQLPSKFFFGGGMVFISNMKSSEIEQAIMSRSIFVDVHLAEQDVLKRIKSIGYSKAKNSGGKITSADIDEVLSALGENNSFSDVKINYMTPEYARKTKQVTVRSMNLALLMKMSGLKNWERLSALYA